jgi:hypothetical protein
MAADLDLAIPGTIICGALMAHAGGFRMQMLATLVALAMTGPAFAGQTGSPAGAGAAQWRRKKCSLD